MVVDAPLLRGDDARCTVSTGAYRQVSLVRGTLLDSTPDPQQMATLNLSAVGSPWG
jgi:hypothetical protein